MAQYEVTDPVQIEYRPVSGGAPVIVRHGGTVDGDDLTDTAREFLLGCGAIGPVSVAKQATTSMERGTLDAIARDAGVPDPEGLPNKDAVVAAIDAVTDSEEVAPDA